jgi:hypothetical protein
MMDEIGVDSLPVALAASLIVLAVIAGLAAQGIRQAGPAVSTASVDIQVSTLSNDCRALLACAPRDLLDPASPPGASKTITLYLPPDTGYVAFGTDAGEGTIFYEVDGNRKAAIVDERVRFREGVKKGGVIVPSQQHRVIEGGGKYELTFEYEYDRGFDKKYIVIY